MNITYLNHYFNADVLAVWMTREEHDGYSDLSPENRTVWHAFARRCAGRFVLIENIENPECAKVKQLSKPAAYRIAYKYLDTIPQDLEPAQYIAPCDPSATDITTESMTDDDAFFYTMTSEGPEGIVGVIPTASGWSLAYFEYDDSDCKPAAGSTYVYGDKDGNTITIKFDGNRFAVEAAEDACKVDTLKELCERYGLSQAECARRSGIPLRTIQDWHAGRRTPPAYVMKMLAKLFALQAR